MRDVFRDWNTAAFMETFQKGNGLHDVGGDELHRLTVPVTEFREFADGRSAFGIFPQNPSLTLENLDAIRTNQIALLRAAKLPIPGENELICWRDGGDEWLPTPFTIRPDGGREYSNAEGYLCGGNAWSFLATRKTFSDGWYLGHWLSLVDRLREGLAKHENASDLAILLDAAFDLGGSLNDRQWRDQYGEDAAARRRNIAFNKGVGLIGKMETQDKAKKSRARLREIAKARFREWIVLESAKSRAKKLQEFALHDDKSKADEEKLFYWNGEPKSVPWFQSQLSEIKGDGLIKKWASEL